LLDCDPGLDDALGIILASGMSADIDVRAIVATFGNVSLERTKNNLLKIVSFFKKKPLLGNGSKGPLSGKNQEARDVHGQDGLGDISGPISTHSKTVFKDGFDLITGLALSKKINIIVATGPLTDLARAIQKKPAFLANLDELVIMGGAVFVKGNFTPYTEFNFHCDPEAARIVLNANIRKRLVALDVTHKALLTEKRLRPLKAIHTEIADFILRIANYSIYANRKRGLLGAPMHDPLAVAIAADAKIGGYKDLCLDVVVRGKRRGMIFVKKGEPNVMFCHKISTGKFFDRFIGTLVKVST